MSINYGTLESGITKFPLDFFDDSVPLKHMYFFYENAVMLPSEGTTEVHKDVKLWYMNEEWQENL